MKSVHTIRLRDPWELRTLPDGRAEYCRRFGKPPLKPGDTVWLVCAGLPVGSAAELNGEPLDVPEAEVSFRLLPRNVLRIVLPEDDLLGRVALEIRTLD